MARVVRTDIRKATDSECDADTIIATLDSGDLIRVYIYSDRDGMTTVSIDPDGDDIGRVRILLQDAVVYEGNAYSG